MYHCFLCNCGDRVNANFLNKLSGGAISLDVVNMVSHAKYNHIGNLKKVDVDFIVGTPNMNSPHIRYIEDRVGTGFTIDDYDKFKIIWDWDNICRSISDKRLLNKLPINNHSISFLSDDKTTILTRQYEDINGRWSKITIFPSENRSMYTIKATLDLFTKDRITINIAEGVLDVISIYKNFSSDNAVYLAVLGSEYISGIEYMIAKGIIGSNVDVKIYIDNGIDGNDLKRRLKKYKWIFGSITILENIKDKDVGTTIDRIRLVERRI